MTDNTLPDRPSELLRMGLEDFAKIEADPRYVADLGRWHEPSLDDGKCHACMAGAVMATRLGADHNEDLIPNNFGDDAYLKLYALNWLHQGHLRSAGIELNNSKLTNFGDRGMPNYRADRAAWWAAEKQLVTDLEAAGL